MGGSITRDFKGAGATMYTGDRTGVAEALDAVVTTADGMSLTDRQQEFATTVGARSALSAGHGCVFVYRQDADGAIRWQISAGGHPIAIDYLV